jgi:hypothetical protein
MACSFCQRVALRQSTKVSVAAREQLDVDGLSDVLPVAREQFAFKGPQAGPGRADEIVRPAGSQGRQVGFADDPAVQDPYPLGLTVLGFDCDEDVAQGGVTSVRCPSKTS